MLDSPALYSVHQGKILVTNCQYLSSDDRLLEYQLKAESPAHSSFRNVSDTICMTNGTICGTPSTHNSFFSGQTEYVKKLGHIFFVVHEQPKEQLRTHAPF